MKIEVQVGESHALETIEDLIQKTQIVQKIRIIFNSVADCGTLSQIDFVEYKREKQLERVIVEIEL